MTDVADHRLTDRIEWLNREKRDFSNPNLRPKDAATLLVLDQAAGGPPRVLMGRRHMRHRFYPGAYVFPGGRVDAADSFQPVVDDYAPETLAKLSQAMRGPKTASRARAFGMAAIRETYEEAGLFIGRRSDEKQPAYRGDLGAFAERGIVPGLGALRFVARAITPPRRPRRFDTRFFVCRANDIADQLAEGVGPSGELEDVAWLTFDEAKATKVPSITVAILDEVADRLAGDPALEPTRPVPFYRWVGNAFRRELI